MIKHGLIVAFVYDLCVLGLRSGEYGLYASGVAKHFHCTWGTLSHVCAQPADLGWESSDK